VRALTPELAYTTVMTTPRRLAGKGLLSARAGPRHRAHEYQAAETPAAFLIRASNREAGDVVARYGEAGLAAFATRLASLTLSSCDGRKAPREIALARRSRRGVTPPVPGTAHHACGPAW